MESASAYFQLFNTKIGGNVDMKSIVAGLEAIESDATLSEQAVSQKEAELFNKHYKLVVFYADSNEKIADTEFYTYTETYSDYDYYDQDGDYYEMVEYSDTDIDMRLVFGDGSKSDFATYFNTGFGKIEAEFEAFRANF